MDRLSPLFKHYSPSVDVFFAGNSCQTSVHSAADGVGHLHLIQSGELLVTAKDFESRKISEPSILFSTGPKTHSLSPVHASGTDMVCATINLGQELNNPFFSTVPPLLVVSTTESPELFQHTQSLFAEAAEQHCGRDAALQLLAEYVLILLLRHAMDSMNIKGCALGALGDPRLAAAISAIHERPEQQWSLDSLASLSNMSRARFAHHFRESVGSTPLEYLTDWRLSLARKMMLAGEPVNTSAMRVGYSNAAAFSRAFDRRTGQSPTQWLASRREMSG